MTAEVLINGVGWIWVPEVAPAELVNNCTLWDECHEAIMRELLPTYGLKRTAWALGRTIHSVQSRATTRHFSYARTNPRVDILGKVA